VCTMLDLTSVSFECFPGKATTLESNIVDKAIGGFLAMTLVQQATLAWSVLLLGALYCGGGVGVVHLVRRRNWMALALPGIVILYFVVLSSGAETSYRFRAPIVPFLAILAGAGYGMLAARWRKPKAKE
jgi:CHASE2 domain-containing sensor protein